MACRTLFFAFAFLVMNHVSGQGPDLSWADSYSVDGKCYCQTTFDHGLREKKVKGPDGKLISIVEACKIAGSGRKEGRIYYNDIICGNGMQFKLNNGAGDEDWCPGRVDLGPGNKSGCKKKGPLFAWLQLPTIPLTTVTAIPIDVAGGPGLFHAVFLVDVKTHHQKRLPVNGTASAILADYPHGLAIRAACHKCATVSFVSGSYTHRESETPFFMHGNTGNKFDPWPNPSPGTRTIKMTGKSTATVETITVTLTFVSN